MRNKKTNMGWLEIAYEKNRNLFPGCLQVNNKHGEITVKQENFQHIKDVGAETGTCYYRYKCINRYLLVIFWEQMRQIEIYSTKYATPPQFHRIPVSFCKIQGFTCSRWIVSKILFINHDPNESNQRHPPKKSPQPSHNDLEMSAPQRTE